MHAVALLLAALVGLGSSPVRPVSTYSIVARDADTGQFGVAVQSHWFDVGSVVPWARAGVGAVATQSLVDISYGPLGLQLMAAGRSASDALNGLVQADEASSIRQVAMVDAGGQALAMTGGDCIPYASHTTGEGYACQANLMAEPGVPEAMAAAYEAHEGPFAERLLAALAAAEAAGGDIRGRQSAAILIVPGEPCSTPWPCEDLRLSVEDHPDPLAELDRLYGLHQGYEWMNRGDLAIEAGDIAAANEAYGTAGEILGAGNLEAGFWHAVALANAGRLDDALPVFAEVFAGGEHWRELPRRLVDPGFLEVTPEELERIEAQ